MPGDVDKICDMTSVREYNEGFRVDLCRYQGRLVIRAFNEAGFNATMVDLGDLMDWLEGFDRKSTAATAPAAVS